MRGKDEKLLDIFNSNGKRFIIPAYQRNYDWKQANCERLFDDLVSLTKSHRDGHFFGSVVTVENEDGFSTERLVIDGQQRVTTVSLLLLAMYRLLDNGEVVSTKEYSIILIGIHPYITAYAGIVPMAELHEP